MSDAILGLMIPFWGRNLDGCVQALQFIAELPIRKIPLRGNHDMFWVAKKTQMLNEDYAEKPAPVQGEFLTGNTA